MDKGYICISRSLLDHWIWNDRPYSKGQAWVDLLLLANYKDTKIPYKGKVITCKRGDVNLSLSTLADKWLWDRRSVKKYLDLLESDGMVSLVCTTHRTTITIVNYDSYQLPCTTECTTKSQQDVQQSPITNKRKERKEIYISIVGYLNEKTGKRYTVNDKTKSLIDARLNDGFTLEDFYKVIDIKVAKWLGNDRMKDFLRPITLFSNKFESYLNESPAEKKKPTGNFGQMEKTNYNFDELEKMLNG